MIVFADVHRCSHTEPSKAYMLGSIRKNALIVYLSINSSLLGSTKSSKQGDNMLKTINLNKRPKNHELRQVGTLLGLFKIYQNFALSSESREKATFLIAEDDKRGVYGGAILYPQEISPSLDLLPNDTNEETLGKLFSAFQPRGKEYWRARVCLCIGHDSTAPILETVKLCQSFYAHLYKAFEAFGEKEKVEYLPFTLQTKDGRLDNHIHILTYEKWPYFLEVKLSDSSHGYFHGILSLKGNKFKVRKQRCVSLNPNISVRKSRFFEESPSLKGKIE